ncbi:2751_t:CDS:1, partial [Acaulospora colombiana]
MSFTIGQKDKSPSPKDSKNPLEEINDPKRRDELETGGMIIGPNHPGFKGERSDDTSGLGSVVGPNYQGSKVEGE